MLPGIARPGAVPLISLGLDPINIRVELADLLLERFILPLCYVHLLPCFLVALLQLTNRFFQLLKAMVELGIGDAEPFCLLFGCGGVARQCLGPALGLVLLFLVGGLLCPGCIYLSLEP